MAQKTDFVQRARGVATELAQLSNRIDDVKAVYNTRLYGPEAANEITQDDIADTGLTKDDVYAMIILFDQVMGVVNGAYGATLEKVRTDL